MGSYEEVKRIAESLGIKMAPRDHWINRTRLVSVTPSAIGSTGAAAHGGGGKLEWATVRLSGEGAPVVDIEVGRPGAIPVDASAVEVLRSGLVAAGASQAYWAWVRKPGGDPGLIVAVGPATHAVLSNATALASRVGATVDRKGAAVPLDGSPLSEGIRHLGDALIGG